MLKILEAYKCEENYTVWEDISTHLGSLAVIVQATEHADAFDKFNVQLYSQVAEKLGWEKAKEEGERVLEFGKL